MCVIVWVGRWGSGWGGGLTPAVINAGIHRLGQLFLALWTLSSASLYLSLSHTHTHTRKLSLSLSLHLFFSFFSLVTCLFGFPQNHTYMQQSIVCWQQTPEHQIFDSIFSPLEWHLPPLPFICNQTLKLYGGFKVPVIVF